MTTDQAGLAFLSLLERITLQDLAILQPDYPGLPFFFSLPSSSDKSGSTLQPSCVRWGDEVPRSVLLERAVPELNAAICTGFQTQERRTKAQEQALEQWLRPAGAGGPGHRCPGR